MHVQDDRPDDTMILNYLPPIGIRAGESALKGDALLTHELHPHSHTQTQDLKPIITKNFYYDFL
jgi:hypothetical protein